MLTNINPVKVIKLVRRKEKFQARRDEALQGRYQKEERDLKITNIHPREVPHKARKMDHRREKHPAVSQSKRIKALQERNKKVERDLKITKIGS